MKKLLFIAMFCFGIFSASNAQWVLYTATNSGGDTWDMAMVSAGNPVATYEYTITPSQVRTGVLTNFAFPFEFKAANQNGCGAYQFVPTTTTGVYVPITNCSNPTALKYRFENVIPFVLWEFEVKFG